MRKTARVAALSATLLIPSLLIAAASHAARRPQAPPSAGLAKRVVERLDLTPQQVQEIRQILASHRTELAAELGRLQETRARLFDTIHAETFDEAAIRNASRAAGQAGAELAVTRGQIVSEVRQVLTPEQRAEAQEMLADARSFAEDLLSHLRQRFEADPLAGL